MSPEEARRRHREAAVGYLGIGFVVIAFTVLGGLVPEGRGLVSMAVGGGFVVLFSVVIAQGWWPVNAILVVTNAGRTAAFVGHGLGIHFELVPPGVVGIEARPLAFVNAVLMGVVVILLARSAGAAWSASRRGAGEGEETR